LRQFKRRRQKTDQIQKPGAASVEKSSSIRVGCTWFRPQFGWPLIVNFTTP
jgi:hypothetical protein